MADARKKPVSKRLLVWGAIFLFILAGVMIMGYIAFKTEAEEGGPRLLTPDDIKEVLDKAEGPPAPPAAASKFPTFSRGASGGGYGAGQTTILRRLPGDAPSGAASHGFSAVDAEFAPSTLGISKKELLKRQALAEDAKEIDLAKEGAIDLSGSLTGEFFTFGIYNTMEDGKLVREGDFLIMPRGDDLEEELSLSFTLKREKPIGNMQLPVILNGRVRPVMSEQAAAKVFIDEYGRMSAQGSIGRGIDVEYTIVRRSENADVMTKLPVSPWLKKEFDCIPPNIKEFLEKAKGGSFNYRMITVSAVMNRYFGYQNNVIPVCLPEVAAWGEYLAEELSQKEKFLCDCDVLSAYAFIFLRFLGMDTVVAVGYNNTQNSHIDTLTSDEHHAALLVRGESGWVFYDPSEYTLDLSPAIETKKSPAEKGGAPDGEGGYRLTRSEAEKFVVPKKVASFLGNAIPEMPNKFQKEEVCEEEAARKDLFDIDEMLYMFKERGLMREWTGIVVLVSMALLMALMLMIAALGLLIPFDKSAVKPPLNLYLLIPAKIAIFAIWGCLAAQAYGARLNYWPVPDWSIYIGTVLILTGSALSVAGRLGSIKAVSGRKKGVYSLSRNPQYSGFFLISAGALFYSPGPITITLAAAAIALHHFLVLKEESFLASKLGKTWTEYSSHTPRYL